MFSNLKPFAINSNIVVQELVDEILIYNLLTNKAYSLNEISAIVWQNCDGRKTIAEIADILGERLDGEPNEDLVRLAIIQLEKEWLIIGTDHLENPSTVKSRRELIKMVGLATMSALPVVSIVMAPTALEAQSVCGCANNEPVGCLNFGTYSLGCSTSDPACRTAAQISGPLHCCHGFAGNIYQISTMCCSVSCMFG